MNEIFRLYLIDHRFLDHQVLNDFETGGSVAKEK